MVYRLLRNRTRFQSRDFERATVIFAVFYQFLDPPGHGMPPGWGIVTGQDFSQEIVKGRL